MNKVLTALLITSVTIPLIACSNTPKQETNQNPLVFKYSSEEFKDYKKTSNSIYTKTDDKGNTTTLNVSPKNNIRSIMHNSAKYASIQECQAQFKTVTEVLDKFINSSDEHSAARNSTTNLRYGSDAYSVTRPSDCYQSEGKYIYFASVVRIGKNLSSIGKEFSGKMSDSGSRIYQSGTTPSSWLTFPKQ